MNVSKERGVSVLLRFSRLFSNTSAKIPQNEGPSYPARLNGWVQKSQKCGRYVFLHVSDGLSSKPVQVVVPKDLCQSAYGVLKPSCGEGKVRVDLAKHPINTDVIHSVVTTTADCLTLGGGCLHVGSAVSISGNYQTSLGSQQEKELLATVCHVLADDVDPRYSSLSPDQLRKKLHLRSRSPSFSALLRLRSKLFLRTHEYFMSRGYVHIDTPMFTANDCEGAGETFSITDSSSKDFFGEKEMFLSVSGQLHLEAMVSGISHVYTLSTGCRADKQQSRNHLTEFKMLEAEIAFCDSLNHLMGVPEDFLRSSVFHLLNDSSMMEDFNSLGSFSSKAHLSVLRSIVDAPPFPRLAYADAVKLLLDKKQKVTGRGLTKLNEAFLVDYHKSPVFVTHFPSEQKPFYMLRSTDGKTTESFDLICPGVCELAGGSIREPSADTLREGTSCVDWYAEIRERGKPISGGFGLGFERLLQLLLGVQNIKDTTPFPRWFRHGQC